MQSQSRRHRRADIDVYVNKILGDEPHLARVRDISEGGLFLYKLLEPETSDQAHVGLEILLPVSREVIWAVAKVVRKEAGESADGVALEFVRISESDRELIRRYVHERQTQPNDSRQAA